MRNFLLLPRGARSS